MRAVAVVVVALFVAVLAVAACARAQVGSWSNCVASFEGTNGTIFYDLNPGTGDKTVEPAGDYKFLMDLCQSVTGTTDPCTAGSTYNCQIAKAGELPFRKVASTATTPIATLDGNGRLVVT
eukprot:Unigene3286_Nuclearia_a/m.10077 Unigene3286_Nuclearia_a/g.10077  ORF Unigene3286_Nuclearia_a/g.10077 Unigene3286_Nuclearia_a/m.10077 type:complete len:121 (-) Unigene3286_Nuclearia_a:2027-2389(-)